jgi:hypothetical protein
MSVWWCCGLDGKSAWFGGGAEFFLVAMERLDQP